MITLEQIAKLPHVWRQEIKLLDPTGATAPMSWIQVARIGSFKASRYGSFAITPDNLRQMFTNYHTNFPARPTELPVDFDHLSMKPEGLMRAGDGRAAGWFKQLELRNNDSELWALIEWSESGAQAIRTREYKFVSPTFMRKFRMKATGQDIGHTLIAAAITNRPFLEGMASVSLSTSGAEVLNLQEVGMPEPGKVVTILPAAIGQRQDVVAGQSYTVLTIVGEGDTMFAELQNDQGMTVGWFRAVDLAPAMAPEGAPTAPTGDPGNTATDSGQPPGVAATGGAPPFAAAAPVVPGAPVTGVPAAGAPAAGVAPVEPIPATLFQITPLPAGMQVGVKATSDKPLAAAENPFEKPGSEGDAGGENGKPPSGGNPANPFEKKPDEQQFHNKEPDMKLKNFKGEEVEVKAEGVQSFMDEQSLLAVAAEKAVHAPKDGETLVSMKTSTDGDAIVSLKDVDGKDQEVKLSEAQTFMAAQLQISDTRAADAKAASETQIGKLEGDVTSLKDIVHGEQKTRHLLHLQKELDKMAGRITKPQREYALKMFDSPDDLDGFVLWQASMPAEQLVALNIEHGAGTTGDDHSEASTQLNDLAVQMAADKGISFVEALEAVSLENAALSKKFRDDITREAIH